MLYVITESTQDHQSDSLEYLTYEAMKHGACKWTLIAATSLLSMLAVNTSNAVVGGHLLLTVNYYSLYWYNTINSH